MKENNQKITEEFCKGKCLIFYPETRGQAELIQREIFELGFRWGNSGSEEIYDPSYCVVSGLILNGGRLYIGHGRGHDEGEYFGVKPVLYCTSSQFDENYVSKCDEAYGADKPLAEAAEVNDQQITWLSCAGETLLFYPKTEEEAALIQREIFEMGFRWSDRSTEVAELAKCVEFGMVLDKRSLLYYSPSLDKRKQGILCTSAQFDENYVSKAELQARRDAVETKPAVPLARAVEIKKNEQKITKEFCEGKTLLFYPKTREEAALIQRKLFEMGFKWRDGSTMVSVLADCVDSGMVLDKESKLAFRPGPDHKREGLLCTSAQLTLTAEEVVAESGAILRAMDIDLQAIEEEQKRVRAEIEVSAKEAVRFQNAALADTFNDPKKDTSITDPKPTTKPSSSAPQKNPKSGV